MKFARYVFLIAGIYGLLVILPLYFMEERLAVEYPPPITHPENFYTFIGVTAAWQVMFLFISRRPVRYRPLMIPCMLEKVAMVVTLIILVPQGRFPAMWWPLAIIDMMIGLFFIVAYIKTKTLSDEE